MKAAKRKFKKLDAERKLVCVACEESFQYKYQLKYHIRQYHFNLVGLAPYANSQNANDVWVEKVQNTATLVEVRKVSNNIILIQKLKDDTIPPTKVKREVIDVRKDYPVCSGGVVDSCRVCQQSFGKRNSSKHFQMKHALLVKKHCNACGTAFKRLYDCVHHICPAVSVNKKLKDDNDESNEKKDYNDESNEYKDDNDETNKHKDNNDEFNENKDINHESNENKDNHDESNEKGDNNGESNEKKDDNQIDQVSGN